MNKKCNLNVFFSEFNVVIKRKVYGVKSFNGYYDAGNYHNHLKQVLSDFKNDMFYELPFQDKGNKDVFLLNIYAELRKKKRNLEIILQKKIENSMRMSCNKYHNSKGLKYIMLMKNNSSCRRIIYMFYLQINSLNIALEIIKQSAINYNINLKINKERNKRSNIVKWIGGELEFLQLLHSFINSEKLDTQIASEDAIITEMAESFGVKITQNTLTSLSRSIHSSNLDYTPKVFDRLLKGYKKFENHRRKLQGHKINM